MGEIITAPAQIPGGALSSANIKSIHNSNATVVMNKIYIDANQLLDDAFELGFRIMESGYKPDLLLAIWRGGTPVGIGIQELLSLYRIPHQHFPIRTSHYADIDQRHDAVLVEGLDTALARCGDVKRILIVDDVHDTGLSMAAVIEQLSRHYGPDGPEVRTATPFFKPGRNQTTLQPDYYLHATEQWIVFPHELMGLEVADILAHKTASPALARHLKPTQMKTP